MAIRTVVTRGYGNGVFSGTIGLVVMRGYIPATIIVQEPPGTSPEQGKGASAGAGDRRFPWREAIIALPGAVDRAAFPLEGSIATLRPPLLVAHAFPGAESIGVPRLLFMPVEDVALAALSEGQGRGILDEEADAAELQELAEVLALHGETRLLRAIRAGRQR
jgi:hypothetical protein